ncbi:NrfD/PsrC family molybdoenzyme membrane anchor subunit [Polyangium sp. y55x31]|uniref:NrfD/PsrC family molybdoenzyme membrane anchor subunit n=1 Tax=Polyangium sp. y55x31 TaxID=3042688 RepID=UPI002482F016|nr:NrfD/PsrC family molybdoenzyme membrane anchor subunit [Polyangium sp. y55x31]MDI1480957.1 polysulfide reductase NrfD [Polyangium sp. y55x31]
MATEPVFIGRPTDAELSDQLLSTAWRPWRRLGKIGFLVAILGTLSLFIGITLTVMYGIGMWGNNIPVAWGFGIINFVWWVGIGHAGTFISAVLLLFEQKWRTSINRFAEAMTLFAILQAAMFPVLHLGRPWFAYWIFPYPATMGVWPQFKSALPWDAAAISTYFTVSLVFWYTGLIPDLAAMRDRAPTRAKRFIYGIFALGFTGASSSYRHYRVVYGLLAGLSTPLVLSVHSIVSSDFAITLVPGWHSTIFPPFFVAGAIFSGFAMVLTLVIPVRSLFRLQNVITKRHLDNLAKMVLVTSWVVTYSYILEFFMAWYSGDEYEIFQFFEARPFGPWAWIFWMMMICNAVIPQVFWFRKARHSLAVLWFVSLLVNVGMWAERFVIIVMGLQRDYLPSAWDVFVPTYVDWSIFLGTMGFFLLLFLLFLRFVPFVPLAEVKELKHELSHEEEH